MPTTRTYSPVEVCELLDLSKSTLLRWEREGVLRRIERDLSDMRDQRQYTLLDIQAVAQKQMEQIEKRYTLVSKDEELVTFKQLEELYQEHGVRRFLAGDLMGLREVAEASEIPGETIQLLLRAASDLYEPGDESFGEILSVLQRVHAKASSKSGAEQQVDGEQTQDLSGTAS